MPEQYNVLIRDLPRDERPRERLERYGANALSTAELLAIILRVGNTGMSVVQLAQLLVSHFGGLRQLAAATVQELSTVSGIGQAKACQTARRLRTGQTPGHLAGYSPPDHHFAAGRGEPGDGGYALLKEEHFRVLFLDTRNQVIANRDISVGSLNASIVHPRETFKAAISHLAAAIIVAHNHPSGDPAPSTEDLALTTRLVQVRRTHRHPAYSTT